MSLCVRRILVDPRFVIDGNIIRSKDLDILNQVNLAAEKIRAEAIADAKRTAKIAQDNAEALALKTEQNIILQASALIERLERQNQIFVQQIEAMSADLLVAAFDRLLVEIPSRDRIAACIRQIAGETPSTLINALLHLHPDDANDLPESCWTIKPDPEIQKGTCRLEAASGEWHADFTTMILALRNALATLGTQNSEKN